MRSSYTQLDQRHRGPERPAGSLPPRLRSVGPVGTVAFSQGGAEVPGAVGPSFSGHFASHFAV
jgi:hypothetical protein